MDPWDFWDKDPMKGRLKVGFTTGDEVVIDVKRGVVNAQAHPLYLEDVNDRLWNWQNIVWVEKVT